jgi:hypothetical protein
MKMNSEALDNLVKANVLKAEPPDQAEFDGLLKLGTNRLKDAHNQDNCPESRFDLAYNAAHALSLAAMRWHGYRPDRQRFIVFQALQHTLNLSPEQWRVLDKAHTSRNLAEYEGNSEVDEQLLAEVLKIAEIVRGKAVALGPVPKSRK